MTKERRRWGEWRGGGGEGEGGGGGLGGPSPPSLGAEIVLVRRPVPVGVTGHGRVPAGMRLTLPPVGTAHGLPTREGGGRGNLGKGVGVGRVGERVMIAVDREGGRRSLRAIPPPSPGPVGPARQGPPTPLAPTRLGGQPLRGALMAWTG